MPIGRADPAAGHGHGYGTSALRPDVPRFSMGIFPCGGERFAVTRASNPAGRHRWTYGRIPCPPERRSRVVDRVSLPPGCVAGQSSPDCVTRRDHRSNFAGPRGQHGSRGDRRVLRGRDHRQDLRGITLTWNRAPSGSMATPPTTCWGVGRPAVPTTWPSCPTSCVASARRAGAGHKRGDGRDGRLIDVSLTVSPSRRRRRPASGLRRSPRDIPPRPPIARAG